MAKVEKSTEQTNVNLFSHFVAKRLQKLMIDGMNFSEAYAVANHSVELLFRLQLEADESVLNLDLTDGSSSLSRANANLLLFSAAYLKAESEGYNTESIVDDFADDNVINNSSGAGGVEAYLAIVNAASTLDFDAVSQRLIAAGFDAPPTTQEFEISDQSFGIINNTDITSDLGLRVNSNELNLPGWVAQRTIDYNITRDVSGIPEAITDVQVYNADGSNTNIKFGDSGKPIEFVSSSGVVMSIDWSNPNAVKAVISGPDFTTEEVAFEDGSILASSFLTASNISETNFDAPKKLYSTSSQIHAASLSDANLSIDVELCDKPFEQGAGRTKFLVKLDSDYVPIDIQASSDPVTEGRYKANFQLMNQVSKEVADELCTASEAVVGAACGPTGGTGSLVSALACIGLIHPLAVAHCEAFVVATAAACAVNGHFGLDAEKSMCAVAKTFGEKYLASEWEVSAKVQDSFGKWHNTPESSRKIISTKQPNASFTLALPDNPELEMSIKPDFPSLQQPYTVTSKVTCAPDNSELSHGPIGGRFTDEHVSLGIITGERRSVSGDVSVELIVDQGAVEDLVTSTLYYIKDGVDKSISAPHIRVENKPPTSNSLSFTIDDPETNVFIDTLEGAAAESKGVTSKFWFALGSNLNDKAIRTTSYQGNPVEIDYEDGVFKYTLESLIDTEVIEDTFKYYTYNHAGESNLSTVYISIPASVAPVANPSSIDVNFGESVSGILTSSDESATYVLVDQPIFGSVELDSNTGDYTYTSNGNDFDATEDSFTFKAISEDALESNVETITINISPTILEETTLLEDTFASIIEPCDEIPSPCGSSNLLLVKEQSSGSFRLIYLLFLIGDNDGNNNNATLEIDFIANREGDSEVSSGAYFELYGVSDDSWSEDTLNWSNRPSSGMLLAEFYVDFNSDKGKTISISDPRLSTYIQNDSNRIVSMMIKRVDLNWDNALFMSKEHPDGAGPSLQFH